MANPFFVQPAQFGQGLQGLAGSIQQFGQQRQEQARLEEQKAYEEAAKQKLMEAVQSNDPIKMREAVIQFPEIGETMTQLFSFTNDRTRDIAKNTYRGALTDTENAEQILQQGISEVERFGGNPVTMRRDLEMLQRNPEAALQSMRVGFAGIAPDEYGSLFGGANDTVAPSSVREWEYYNSLSEPEQRQYLNMKRASQTFRQGDVQMVQDPVQPQQADPVRQSGQAPTTQEQEQQRLTEQQATKAATEEAATQAIKTSKEAFDQIRPVKSAISNIDEAINLVDEGANTGVVYSKLPSVQEASIALDNLQGRMGLDVIGNTTFGALSESELNFALSTALPKNLEGPALKEWLQRKKQSQQKLANYLEDAATFLGRPGNIIADFIEKQRESGEQQGGLSEDEADAFINEVLGR